MRRLCLSLLAAVCFAVIPQQSQAGVGVAAGNHHAFAGRNLGLGLLFNGLGLGGFNAGFGFNNGFNNNLLFNRNFQHNNLHRNLFVNQNVVLEAELLALQAQQFQGNFGFNATGCGGTPAFGFNAGGYGMNFGFNAGVGGCGVGGNALFGNNLFRRNFLRR